MVPHEGTGGCTPMPKKLNPASISMAEAKFAAEMTITGPMMLGRICLPMMRILEKPSQQRPLRMQRQRHRPQRIRERQQPPPAPEKGEREDHRAFNGQPFCRGDQQSGK